MTLKVWTTCVAAAMIAAGLVGVVAGQFRLAGVGIESVELVSTDVS